MLSPSRIFTALGILVLLCANFAWFFGPQTFYVWKSHELGRTQPALWLTPVELPDTSISHSPGRKLSYFGYEFEVPWQDVDDERSKTLSSNKAIIAFRSGSAVSFWSGPADEIMNALSAGGKIDRKSLGQLMGSESVQSDYEYQRAVLNVTPGSFSIFMPKQLAAQRWISLMMKTIVIPLRTDSIVFSVTTKEFKGFQYGRVVDPPKPVVIELYAPESHLSILIGQSVTGAVTISQADINRIVQSVHKLSGPETGSEVNTHRTH